MGLCRGETERLSLLLGACCPPPSPSSPSPSSSSPPPTLHLSVWQFPGYHQPLCGRLLPLRLAVQDLVRPAAVDGYRLSYLPLHRLLEGPEYLKIEGSGVPFPLWVLLPQVFGEGIALILGSDLLGVLAESRVPAVACLPSVYCSPSALFGAELAASLVEGTGALV